MRKLLNIQDFKFLTLVVVNGCVSWNIHFLIGLDFIDSITITRFLKLHAFKTFNLMCNHEEMLFISCRLLFNLNFQSECYTILICHMYPQVWKSHRHKKKLYFLVCHRILIISFYVCHEIKMLKIADVHCYPRFNTWVTLYNLLCNILHGGERNSSPSHQAMGISLKSCQLKNIQLTDSCSPQNYNKNINIPQINQCLFTS